MKRNKKILYTTLAIASPLIIGFTTFSLLFLNKKTEPRKVEIEKKEDEDKNDYKYVIKEINGKIRVFENGKNTPIQTLEKEVEYLPEYDKKILKDGIYVESNQELNKVLEDYED